VCEGGGSKGQDRCHRAAALLQLGDDLLSGGTYTGDVIQIAQGRTLCKRLRWRTHLSCGGCCMVLHCLLLLLLLVHPENTGCQLELSALGSCRNCCYSARPLCTAGAAPL
jgi:hypothetical protein